MAAAGDFTKNERLNYAKLCRIIVEEFRNIMYDIICHFIVPSRIPDLVQGKIEQLNFYPDSKEKIMKYRNVEDDDLFQYHLDVTAVNRIITKINVLDETVVIDENDDNYLDEVENLYKIRNEHSGHSSMAAMRDEKYNEILKRICQIFDRLDECLRTDHRAKVDDIVESDMNTSTVDEWIQKFSELEEYHVETRGLAENNRESIDELKRDFAQWKEQSGATGQPGMAVVSMGRRDVVPYSGDSAHINIENMHININSNVYNTPPQGQSEARSETKAVTNSKAPSWKCSVL